MAWRDATGRAGPTACILGRCCSGSTISSSPVPTRTRPPTELERELGLRAGRRRPARRARHLQPARLARRHVPRADRRLRPRPRRAFVGRRADVRALEAGGGLATWAVATDDIDEDVARLNAGGAGLSAAIEGERRRPDGTIVRWRLSAPRELGPRTSAVPDRARHGCRRVDRGGPSDPRRDGPPDRRTGPPDDLGDPCVGHAGHHRDAHANRADRPVPPVPRGTRRPRRDRWRPDASAPTRPTRRWASLAHRRDPPRRGRRRSNRDPSTSAAAATWCDHAD